MLAEIEEEKTSHPGNKKLTQEEILEMVREKEKEKRDIHGQ
jgi:hypothetical protein